MATFSETCAPPSRKYVGEQGIVMANLSQKLQFLWWHSSVFPLEKQPKKLIFQRFFTFKTPFGGYFQGNVYTHFQKVCIKIRQNISDLAEKFQVFWSHSSVFVLENIKLKSKFQTFFTSKLPLVATFKKTYADTFRKYVSELDKSITDLAKRLQIFW